MTSINLPKYILDSNKIRKLTPSEKSEYTLSLIKQIVELNPHGVTVTLIAKATDLSRNVISKHLEKMIATNESYYVKLGQSKIYYPNSRAMHPILPSRELRIGDRIYNAFLVDNPFGKFVYLQEKKQEDYSTEVIGGILIPINGIKDFMEFVETVKKEMERKENES